MITKFITVTIHGINSPNFNHTCLTCQAIITPILRSKQSLVQMQQIKHRGTITLLLEIWTSIAFKFYKFITFVVFGNWMRNIPVLINHPSHWSIMQTASEQDQETYGFQWLLEQTSRHMKVIWLKETHQWSNSELRNSILQRKKHSKAHIFSTFQLTHLAQHFFHKHLNKHLIYKYKPKEFMTNWNYTWLWHILWIIKLKAKTQNNNFHRLKSKKDLRRFKTTCGTHRNT